MILKLKTTLVVPTTINNVINIERFVSHDMNQTGSKRNFEKWRIMWLWQLLMEVNQFRLHQILIV